MAVEAMGDAGLVEGTVVLAVQETAALGLAAVMEVGVKVDTVAPVMVVGAMGDLVMAVPDLEEGMGDSAAEVKVAAATAARGTAVADLEEGAWVKVVSATAVVGSAAAKAVRGSVAVGSAATVAAAKAARGSGDRVEASSNRAAAANWNPAAEGTASHRRTRYGSLQC
ncbi:hypothetical protein GPECTOR_22g812 [Gonium pectorale]|uniref:Uncharacterized protein n=1 Tax=Gonium pectorale TaxID=33097 RepID=A0A150GH94_GONPE|nr:hypothetical protein GPECTOR_22g812 [Gonium pectorale]|eukprot:KXZ49221.1 hypothetical protein GPECTOR_22g812 [Gonium pectorale]